MKAITLYKRWMKTGIMPEDGLCSCLNEYYELEKHLKLFFPTQDELDKMLKEEKSRYFWASDLHAAAPERKHTFTELRQTILLFIAAMNNEL
jgi:hypothetical protein